MRPRTLLALDADGSVVCLDCIPATISLPPNAKAVEMAERWTKMLVGILVAMVTILYIVTRSAR